MGVLEDYCAWLLHAPASCSGGTGVRGQSSTYPSRGHECAGASVRTMAARVRACWVVLG